MDLRVLGAREFRLLAADCRDAGRRDLERELRRALNRSVAPTAAAIRAAAGRAMPSGYGGVLAPALQVAARSTSATGIRMQVSARGKAEDRDVRSLDRGLLRHPVFGRQHRRAWTKGRPRKRIPGGQLVTNPWAVTKVPPGFVTGTFDREADAIIDRLGGALDAIAAQLARG